MLIAGRRNDSVQRGTSGELLDYSAPCGIIKGINFKGPTFRATAKDGAPAEPSCPLKLCHPPEALAPSDIQVVLSCTAHDEFQRVVGFSIAPLHRPQGCGTPQFKFAQRLAHPPTVHPESIRRYPWVTYASDASGVNRNYAQW